MTDDRLPPSSVPDVAAGAALGLSTATNMPPSAAASVGAACERLARLQRDRRFAIVAQMRINGMSESYIAGHLGYHPGLSEAERKALWKKVSVLRKSIEKGGGGRADDEHQIEDALSADALATITSIVLESANSRVPWDNLRKAAEKNMQKVVKTLPVYEWAKGVRGFGDVGLGIIIGETTARYDRAVHTLSDYATKERVWKRLGLAVIDGVRQRRVANNPAAALVHNYDAQRRAEIWTIGDSMFRHQWRAAKDDLPAGPLGPYGEVYRKRKAHTEGREGWTLKHREDDARRIMTKALIEDLWRVWNGLESRYAEAGAASPMKPDRRLPSSSAALAL